VIENMKSSENKYFVPFVWATTIVERASKEGKIKGEIAVQKVLNASTNTHSHTHSLTYLLDYFVFFAACMLVDFGELSSISTENGLLTGCGKKYPLQTSFAAISTIGLDVVICIYVFGVL